MVKNIITSVEQDRCTLEAKFHCFHTSLFVIYLFIFCFANAFFWQMVFTGFNHT